MSDVNLDFTVNNNSIDFTVAPNDITITPTDIQLTFSSTSGAGAGGNTGELQYKITTLQLGGVPNTLFDGSNLTLGNVANLKITGGINGYVLQTDGTGNLDWTAQTGNGGGNGSPGGSNTQIQYNDSGSFGGNAGFTFNEITGNVNIPGNLSVVGNVFGGNINANNSNFAGNAVVAGTVYTNAQPNITSLGNLTSLNVAGVSSIQSAKEKVNIITTPGAGNAGVTVQLVNQAIDFYVANATNNFTINIIGNGSTSVNTLLSSNQSMTTSVMITNGAANTYYANVIQIDGSTITPKWVGNVPVGGTANAISVYTFNIIKTASSTYTVLGSLLGYK
jgi:hypothetical protein